MSKARSTFLKGSQLCASYSTAPTRDFLYPFDIYSLSSGHARPASEHTPSLSDGHHLSYTARLQCVQRAHRKADFCRPPHEKAYEVDTVQQYNIIESHQKACSSDTVPKTKHAEMKKTIVFLRHCDEELRPAGGIII